MNQQQIKAREKFLWPVVFLTIMIKYAYYGYSYYPLMDDNNMYGFFHLYKNIFKEVILGFGMYTTRPIAVLLDPYLWARFWGNLGFTLVIMTVLHFLICFLAYKTFEKSGLPIGMPAILIFALLPFGSEATYWLAASSRVVVGMFFMALSFYLLYLYFENEKSSKPGTLLLILFWITHLVSLGFYEQIIAMSFMVLLLIFAVKWRSLSRKWVVGLPIINFGIIATWYKVFSSTGNMADRGQIVQGGVMGILRHSYDVMHAVCVLWRTCWADFIRFSFPGGIKTIISDKSYAFLIVFIFLCILVFRLMEKENFKSGIRNNIVKFLIGLYLFLTPYTPFFAINLLWIANRNIFLSFVGLGLMAEAGLCFIAFNKPMIMVRNILVDVMAFTFLAANVYELTYYRNVGKIDSEITMKISQMPESKQGKDLILFNSKSAYINPTAGRIENCTGSSWGLTGALYAQRRDSLKMKNAYPVADQVFVQMQKDAVKSSSLLGIDDSRNIFTLSVGEVSGDMLKLIKSDGSEFGEADFTDDGYMVFRLK